MQVQELIALLQTMPMEATVVIEESSRSQVLSPSMVVPQTYSDTPGYAAQSFVTFGETM
jgi:hypothetical protein